MGRGNYMYGGSKINATVYVRIAYDMGNDEDGQFDEDIYYINYRDMLSEIKTAIISSVSSSFREYQSYNIRETQGIVACNNQINIRVIGDESYFVVVYELEDEAPAYQLASSMFERNATAFFKRFRKNLDEYYEVAVRSSAWTSCKYIDKPFIDRED